MTISRGGVIAWLKAFAAAIEVDKDHLTMLDAEIGDSDHGANMHRGLQAVLTKLPTVADKDIGAVFTAVGMTLVSTVGGAAGPLYGTFFIQMGTTAAGKLELNLADWVAAMQAGVDGVMMRGKTMAGDKTMVDTLVPALEALKAGAAANQPFSTVLRNSARAAEEGMRSTIPLIARRGRASYLGERSAGHQDPGATSSCLLIQAAASAALVPETHA